ncbi:Translin [Pseudomassariella vexata]|uniref:Translin n=1 Tax=Pseudomassariella vexata TaxID=1141098 RepID=A0A1Y2DGU0_9PEZI|nr:Translin [Pseudomassariella vexata]ORY57925.1 Translin [Pseudomassariella vexata]
MVGVKRDHQGNKKEEKSKEIARNAYTSIFEGFRDELDEHHDRRQRIGKVSRDVTALSKKIIFALQRVRKLNQPVPERLAAEIQGRVKEIKELLNTIEADVQGINRYRYPLICLEEFVEAVSFMHYLQHQTLITPAQSEDELKVNIPFTHADYVYGIFDLTGEMMRFAISVTALTGSMPGDSKGRTILTDLQEVSSMLQILPPLSSKNWSKKVDVMVEQVKKVERVGYGVTVRGNERPKGWMPDMNEAVGGREEHEESAD